MSLPVPVVARRSVLEARPGDCGPATSRAFAEPKTRGIPVAGAARSLQKRRTSAPRGAQAVHIHDNWTEARLARRIGGRLSDLAAARLANLRPQMLTHTDGAAAHEMTMPSVDPFEVVFGRLAGK